MHSRMWITGVFIFWEHNFFYFEELKDLLEGKCKDRKSSKGLDEVMSLVNQGKHNGCVNQ